MSDDYIRARTVYRIELRDACDQRKVVGVRATERRHAWKAAELAYPDWLAVACRPEDRQVDLDAGC
jgi:hypothetical protein